MNTRLTRTQRLTRAALIASDWCHECLPFRSAELAVGMVMRAYTAGDDHVPASRPDDWPGEEVPRILTVAQDAFELVRIADEADR